MLFIWYTDYKVYTIGTLSYCIRSLSVHGNDMDAINCLHAFDANFALSHTTHTPTHSPTRSLTQSLTLAHTHIYTRTHRYSHLLTLTFTLSHPQPLSLHYTPQLHHLSPSAIQLNGYIERLRGMLHDKDVNVVTNVIIVLDELLLDQVS